MQMLCQISKVMPRLLRSARRCARNLASLFLWVLATQASAQNLTVHENALNQVAQWVKQNLQLSEGQFSFAPLDSRVRVQGCDRALTMDLPFASRETVRVRCQSDAPWQMYLRLVLTAPVASPVLPRASDAGPVSARRVVVATQLLRRGTTVSPELLQEVDHSGLGLDPQTVTSIKDVENAEMVRDIAAGTPLRSHDVKRATLVKQGQSVLLTIVQGNGLSVTARVDALQDGKLGEQVRLKNPESGRLVPGIVTGPNAARAQQ